MSFKTLIANADIRSLKSLHALFDKYFDHMLVKFEQNCKVQIKRIVIILTNNRI